METIGINNGKTFLGFQHNGNCYSMFNKLIDAIKDKKCVKTFTKPAGNYIRYEVRDENNVIIECSFWIAID